jgi:hypothetical protein
MSDSDPALDVMEGQAEVQSVLGRLKLRDPDSPEIEPLERGLAFLHRALWYLDRPMYRPARHPDAPNPQSDEQL